MRIQNSKIAFTAALMLAITFTFSCYLEGNNSDDTSYEYCITTDNKCLTGPFTASTCSGQPSNNCPYDVSSSSSRSSSSVLSKVVYGTPVTYQGETYKTVVIGTQTWFQRNLNYDIEGSKCYNNNPANCEKYGRLYDWATAMAIDSKYNKEGWGESDEKHKGICPTGWHLPSEPEWKTLMLFAGTSQQLQSTSDNGTDDYGFAALLGGYGHGSQFTNINFESDWWTATEYSEYYVTYAYAASLQWADISGRLTKSFLTSVRCIKDNDNPISSSSIPSSSSRITSSSSLVPSSSSNSVQSGVVYGTPVTYQGETYKTVVIGTQTWFQRNLNYAVDGSMCYDDDPANCAIYGRLYNWLTAMNLPASCVSSSCASQINTKHRGICPSGWHIPSYAEWKQLDDYIENENDCWGCAGKFLKSKSGWDNNGGGNDAYGFSALPGGSSDDRFDDVGNTGSWWSATEAKSSSYADFISMGYDSDILWLSLSYYKSNFYSVRCLKD